MGVKQFAAEAHASAMKMLLPAGRLWRLDAGSVLSLVLLAAGDELARISGRSADMVEEADSATTTELLEDFERELLLPSTGTDADRRLRIVALEKREQKSRPLDVQVALAPYLDLAEVDVEVIETSRADAIATGDDTDIYRFHVYRDPALPGTPDLAAAQLELDIVAQSHTLGRVCESKSMICDEAESLCDRDLVGI